jgi:hypothetical protein
MGQRESTERWGLGDPKVQAGCDHLPLPHHWRRRPRNHTASAIMAQEAFAAAARMTSYQCVRFRYDRCVDTNWPTMSFTRERFLNFHEAFYVLVFNQSVSPRRHIQQIVCIARVTQF